MKLEKVQSSIAFKRALTSDELSEYKKVLSEARAVANNGGNSIFIVHDSCLPQTAATDTGVGHLTSKSSSEFFDYIKTYFGINSVEVLPQGEIQLRHTPGFYNTYNGSALSLGSQVIDPELLTTDPRYHSILSKEDFQELVNSNQKTVQEGLANYENVVGSNSKQDEVLRKAFDNFRNNPELDGTDLKRNFEEFKKANSDWLKKKSIYEVLKKENQGKEWTEWTSELDKTLFDSADSKNLERIAQIKASPDNAKEIEFQMFKQFLAEDHLRLGRKGLNDKNIKLIGDCLIGFSQDEVWGNKKAFTPNAFIGDTSWKLPALNFETILNPDSEAQKLLKRKVELFAQRYDGIRFDCSWSYVEPKLSNGQKFNFGGKILDIIEDTVKKTKEAKGERFVLTDLIHEFEADPKDFSILDPAKRLKPFLENKVKIISSAYLSKEYGSASIMRELGIPDEDFVIGVGNHDHQPLRQIAQDIPDIEKGKYIYRRAEQTRVLSDILNIDPRELTTPCEFSKAKFAEPLTAKNQMLFYIDAFGRKERFDSQALNSRNNYRFRIPINYQRQYEQAVQDGFGYNPMDAYVKVFRLKGLDKTNNTLFQKIIKFRDILSQKLEDTTKNLKNKAVSGLSKNRIFNIGAVIVALGLAGLVINSTKNSLKEIK